MEGGGAGNDRELLSKTLQFEHKLYYFDLKQNPRGQYLKISEKTSATRSTIIVPALEGVHWFLELFNYYVTTDERDMCNKELKLDTKVYYFDIGENKRGRFLKVSEASVSRNRSTIIVPAGSSGEEGWTSFRNILQEIYDEASRLYIVPNQLMGHPGDLPSLSDDVGAGFISGHSTHPVSRSDLHVDRLVDMQQQDGSGSTILPNYIRAEQKRFYFDLGSNNRGHFLRISEVAGMDRSSIILPLSGLKQFHEMIGRFVEISKETVEGITNANVSEASVSRNRSTIIVPAGSSGEEEGWTSFRNILQEIYDEASRLYIVPNQQLMGHPGDLPSLSDDVGAGFISGHSIHPVSRSDLHVDRLVDMQQQDGSGSTILPNYIRAEQKRFYFDLGSNNRGHFLRISEVAGMDRSSIILPLSGLKQFHEMIGRFVEISKETVEGITNANVHTLEPALGGSLA